MSLPQNNIDIQDEQLDLLCCLNDESSFIDKLEHLLIFIKQHHNFINRIAVALYDPDTDLLKTFAHATDDQNPLPHYQAKLSESESLTQIKNQRTPRILNNMNPLSKINTQHSKKITEIGFQSNFTIPIYKGEQFIGFIFFNSKQLNAMQNNVVTDLSVIAQLISILIINELNFVSALKGMTNTLAAMANYRDLETGQHLIRVSHFSRLIAHRLAKKYDLPDEFVEHVFMFSPMHDIGKIAIPDNVLCKPGRFTKDEYSKMKTHTTKGRDIIVDLQKNMKMLPDHSFDMLKNIVYYHHECWDGSGYPEGLAGEAIPLEARILAVADVFDALTSKRVYKKDWAFDDAVNYLNEKKGIQFDPACVDCFLEDLDEVRSITCDFKDDGELMFH